MLKPQEINSIEEMRQYLEGCLNDFEAGIATKEETLDYLGEYTGRVIEIAKKIRDSEIINQLPDVDLMEQISWELGKESTAPDKETPDWMIIDIRRGMNWMHDVITDIIKRYHLV